MSSVFLLSCNTATEPYPVYPLGMSVVAAGLQAAGHRVRQFDWLASGRDRTALAAALEECAPDYVGLSLRNIDNVDSLAGEEHWYLGQARELAAFMRGICAAPFVVGGPAFSIMPHAVLEFLGADYGVCGAGEDAMPELIAALENGEGPAAHHMGARGSAPVAAADRCRNHGFLPDGERTGQHADQTRLPVPLRLLHVSRPGRGGLRLPPR